MPDYGFDFQANSFKRFKFSPLRLEVGGRMRESSRVRWTVRERKRERVRECVRERVRVSENEKERHTERNIVTVTVTVAPDRNEVRGLVGLAGRRAARQFNKTRFSLLRQALAGTGIVVADMDFPSNDVEDARKRGLQPAGSLRPPHSLRILSILGDI